MNSSLASTLHKIHKTLGATYLKSLSCPCSSSNWSFKLNVLVYQLILKDTTRDLPTCVGSLSCLQDAHGHQTGPLWWRAQTSGNSLVE